jgi:hypothetical protein
LQSEEVLHDARHETALPSHTRFPQLFFGSVPARTVAQVPSGCPVRTALQAWHPPVQALLQQTPPAQEPEEQSAFT